MRAAAKGDGLPVQDRGEREALLSKSSGEEMPARSGSVEVFVLGDHKGGKGSPPERLGEEKHRTPRKS